MKIKLEEVRNISKGMRLLIVINGTPEEVYVERLNVTGEAIYVWTSHLINGRKYVRYPKDGKCIRLVDGWVLDYYPDECVPHHFVIKHHKTRETNYISNLMLDISYH